MYKNYLISIGYFFIILLTSTLIITTLNYFNLLPSKIVSIIKLLIPIISITIASYNIGIKSKQKGYLEGIKIGIIIITIFIIITLITDKIQIKTIIYYLIVLLTSILSSMLGINRKKT